MRHVSDAVTLLNWRLGLQVLSTKGQGFSRICLFLSLQAVGHVGVARTGLPPGCFDAFQYAEMIRFASLRRHSRSARLGLTTLLLLLQCDCRMLTVDGVTSTASIECASQLRPAPSFGVVRADIYSAT